MRQGHFQLARSAALYGFQPANGEGIANTNGATSVNLPPDSNGNDTVVTYDNGQMGLFLIQQIGAIIRDLKQRGFTILLVEQNFHFAATVADRRSARRVRLRPP